MLFSIAWQGHAENKAFRLYGQKARIEPVDKYIISTTTRTTKGTGWVLSELKEKSVDAYFYTVENKRVKLTTNIPPAVVNRLINGEIVEITYVSNNTSLVRFDNHNANPGAAAVIGTIVFICSLLLRVKR